MLAKEWLLKCLWAVLLLSGVRRSSRIGRLCMAWRIIRLRAPIAGRLIIVYRMGIRWLSRGIRRAGFVVVLSIAPLRIRVAMMQLQGWVW